MSSIFISHSSKDHQASEALADFLKGCGFRSLFLDIDPEFGIHASCDWEQELYRKLHECRAVVLLCSEHSMASDWCFGEIIYARSRGKHLFPVIISPCTLRPILKDLQFIDLTKNQAQGYERLLAGLKHAGLDPADQRIWQGDRPPYPGLMAFEEADAPVFFGRDRSIREGVDSLIKMRRYGTSRLLMLLGASGSGKSSVVRAGLLPQLKRDPRWLVVDPFRPRDNPFEELAIQLSRCFSSFSHDRPWKHLLPQELSATPDSWLPDLAREIRQAADQPETTMVITVDQFEELLVSDPNHPAQSFLDFLACALAGNDNRLLVIGTMRSDFLGAFQAEPRLADLKYKALNIPTLTVDDFSQVITGPAQVADIELEQGLVEALIQDTATPDALPLLAFTLRELWESHGDERVLTKAQYRQELGGLEGSIRQVANDVLTDMALSASQLAALQTALRRLVRINEEGQYTRQVVLRHELPAESQQVLQRLVEARLLISGKQRISSTSSAADNEAEDSLEVAHEALFRAWDLFKNTLNDDRGFLLWRKRMLAAMRNWQHVRQDRKALLSGNQLAEARAYVKARSEDLNSAEQTFLQASIARARRQRGLRYAVICLILGLTAGLAAQQWWARNQVAAELFQKHWLMATTERDGRQNWLKAGFYLASAVELRGDPGAQAAFQLIHGGTRLSRILDHGEPISGAVLSAQAEKILLWGKLRITLWQTAPHKRLFSIQSAAAVRKAWFDQAGKVLIWNKEDQIQLIEPEQAPSRFQPLFSGREKGRILNLDGDQLLIKEAEGNLQLWNYRDNVLLGQANVGQAVSAGTLHAQTGRTLLWREGAEKALLWNWQQSSPPIELSQPHVAGGQFTPDGKRAYTWDISGNLQTWDTVSGSRLGSQESHGMSIQRPQFSAAGDRLLIWGRNKLFIRQVEDLALTASKTFPFDLGGARLGPAGARIMSWAKGGDLIQQRDTLSGAQVAMPLAHDSTSTVLFFPNGQEYLTAGDDGTARIWSSEAQPPLLAHPVDVPVLESAALDDFSRRLITTGGGMVQAWSFRGEPLSEPIVLDAYQQADQPPPLLTLSSRGERVLGHNALAISIWDSRTGQKLAEYAHQRDPAGVTQVEFDPSGRRALIWSDNRLYLWREQQGRAEVDLLGDNYINARFSSSGDHLLARLENDRVEIWATNDKTILGTIGHADLIGALLIEEQDMLLSWDSQSEGNVIVWAVDGSKERFRFKVNEQIRNILASPTSRSILVLGKSAAVSLWDLNKKPQQRRIIRPGEQLNQAMLSPSGERILTWGARQLRIWDTESGRSLSPLIDSAGRIRQLALSADAQLLLIRNDRQLLIWDLERGPGKGPASALLAQQIACGCRLNEKGELEMLSSLEWQNLNKER